MALNSSGSFQYFRWHLELCYHVFISNSAPLFLAQPFFQVHKVFCFLCFSEKTFNPRKNSFLFLPEKGKQKKVILE